MKLKGLLGVWAVSMMLNAPCWSAEKSAARHPFGAGLMLGDPTGLAFRFPVSEKWRGHSYLEFLGKTLTIGLDVVHVFPGPEFVKAPYRKDILPYIGGGALFQSREGSGGLGLRVPVGVEWQPTSLKQVGVFFEVAPGALFDSSGAWGFFNVAIGALYYF